MGNYPSMGTKGGTVIGSLELNLCKDSCCMCAPTWNTAGCCQCQAMMCCPGMALPSGAEWEAAKGGFDPFLDEAAAICKKHNSCCADIHAMKSSLDADWLNRANDYLSAHGLQVEVCAFWTSDGKSSSPHLVLQFSKK